MAGTLMSIDTCEWLYVAEDNHPAKHAAEKVLASLEQIVLNGKVDLLVPTIILDEWNRNKGKMLERRIKSERQLCTRIQDWLRYRSGDPDTSLVEQWLQRLRQDEATLEARAKEPFDRIDRLLAAGQQQFPSEWAKTTAADLSLYRKAPFHHKPDSMGDALIFLSTVEYLRDNPGQYSRAYFITHNKKDFSQPTGDERVLHPDLQQFSSEVVLSYSTNIAETINGVEEALIQLDVVEELDKRSGFKRVEYRCPRCGSNEQPDYSRGVYHMGNWGRTLWLPCPDCNYPVIDTGDSMDDY